MANNTEKELADKLTGVSHIGRWNTPDGWQSGQAVPLDLVLEIVPRLIETEATRREQALLDELQLRLQPISSNTTARNEERQNILAVIELKRQLTESGDVR